MNEVLDKCYKLVLEIFSWKIAPSSSIDSSGLCAGNFDDDL